MRTSSVIAAAGPASQAAPSRKLGTINARVKAKAEAGRSRREMTREAQFLRARAVLIIWDDKCLYNVRLLTRRDPENHPSAYRMLRLCRPPSQQVRRELTTEQPIWLDTQAVRYWPYMGY